MNRSQRAITTTLVVLCLTSLAVMLFAFVRHRGYERGIVEPLKEDLVRRTREAAQRIDTSLAPARAAVESMVEALDTSQRLGEEQLLELLREAVLSDDSNYGGTVAFEPYRFDAERRLYAPYLGKKNGDLTFLRIEESYDYTDASQEWYSRALAEGPRWSEPYFDTSVGDILMITYSGVFGAAEDPLGVVTIDVSMEAIKRVVRSLDLGGIGYAVLLTQGDGQFLYHPNEEFVRSGLSLRDRGELWQDRQISASIERILEGGSGIVDHQSPTTGLDTWFAFASVPQTNWSLMAAFVKEDAPIDTGVLRRWQIVLGAAAVIFLVSGAALLLRVVRGGRRPLWTLSILSSVLFLVGIGFTWNIALKYDSSGDVDGSIITDGAGLLNLEQEISDRARERSQVPPVFVSTGVLIDSLRFDGGTDVEMSGYVWQKLDPELHAEIGRGVSLAGVAEQRIGEPQIQQGAEGEQVIRWPFEVAQRVRFESSNYPLMRERFALRIVPRSRSSSVLLVPDLEAFPTLSPATRPGLDENVFLPGWTITRTFFELRERQAVTDFGLGPTGSSETLPALYFNFEIRKEFMDTFVSNLVPLIILAVVVFLVLMIIEREEDQILLMRAGPGFNLSICGTLLFVAVFSHIGARQKIAAQEIIYLEYFYIVMYFALLWVAIDSILYVRWPESKFIQYDKNLLPKVLFWPVTLGAIWVVTLVTFY